MNFNISDLYFKNVSRETYIARLRHSAGDAFGEIVNIDNFGLMEMTSQWNDNLTGDEREFVDNRVNAISYPVTVLSDVYDATTQVGDSGALEVHRKINGVNVVNTCFGVIQGIERNRFELHGLRVYETIYTLFVCNPFWYYNRIVEPTGIEETDMILHSSNVITLSKTEQIATFMLQSYQLNVKRGIKLVFAPGTSETWETPLEMVIRIGDLKGTVVLKNSTNISNFVLLLGESVVNCNGVRAIYDNAWSTDILDKYTDYSAAHITPIQWDGTPYEVGISLSSASANDGNHITVSLYLIMGEYF